MGRRVRWVALALAILVCLGRVYVGAHLPLDVIGGAVFGWVIGSLVNLLVGIRTSRGEDPRQASWAYPNESG
jgi:undecaprenyl-diphosphatase